MVNTIRQELYKMFHHDNIMPKTNNCENVAIIPQIEGICWMTTMLTCFFYSDRMHDIIKKRSKTWFIFKYQKAKPIFQAILDKDLKITDPDAYSQFFSEFSAEKIVKYLHEEEPLNFLHNPTIHKGCQPSSYIQNMLEYMDIHDHIILHAIQNEEGVMDIFVENIFEQRFRYEQRKTPLIIVMICGSKEYFARKFGGEKNYQGNRKKTSVNIDVNKNITDYNGKAYDLDCVILQNYNNTQRTHVIAEITCNNERYIYNGWLQSETNNPCPLEKMDWTDVTKKPFVLNKRTCKIDFVSDSQLNRAEKSHLVFKNAYSKYDNRICIFVRNDTVGSSSSKKIMNSSPKHTNTNVTKKTKNAKN
jgi:hypothetical protein